MSILPHEFNPLLESFVTDAALQFEGWKFSALGEDEIGAYLLIERSGNPVKLRGRIGYAWMIQENVSSDVGA